MKVLVFYSAHGSSKTIEIKKKEEQRLYGKSLGDQFDGALIDPEFAGCVMELRGGNDHQGICMVSGKQTTKRMRLLLSKGDTGYRARKAHIRKRKTVRGSIVSADIMVLNVVLVRVPEGRTIPGLTDVIVNCTHAPKRASKLRALFNIPENHEDIAGYVAKLYAETQPGVKVPKLKVTGILSAAEKAKRAQKLALRQAKKEKFLKEKKEYEAKYGVTL